MSNMSDTGLCHTPEQLLCLPLKSVTLKPTLPRSAVPLPPSLGSVPQEKEPLVP